MIQDINRNEVDRINQAVCSFFGITTEQLYSKNKKNRVCTTAFCHILYYLHCECGASISQLAKEYNRKRRIISYHIANEKDFMRIYDTTRKEYQNILDLLQEKS
jgi:chromosomal replication initiation ATPase DnaA